MQIGRDGQGTKVTTTPSDVRNHRDQSSRRTSTTLNDLHRGCTNSKFSAAAENGECAHAYMRICAFEFFIIAHECLDTHLIWQRIVPIFRSSEKLCRSITSISGSISFWIFLAFVIAIPIYRTPGADIYLVNFIISGLYAALDVRRKHRKQSKASYSRWQIEFSIRDWEITAGRIADSHESLFVSHIFYHIHFIV